MIPYIKSEDDIILTVRVVPRASKSQIVGVHDGALKVRIASPPVDGAANAELIKVLARHFDVAKSDIRIMAGENSTNKRIKVANLSESTLREKLA